MAKFRGKNAYFQVLLGPNRALLLEKLAENQNKKVMHVIRDLIYTGLQKKLTASEYNAAEALDQAVWLGSVASRVKGRTKAS